MAQVLQIPFFITEKNSLLSFKNQEILLFKVKKIFFLNLTVPQGTVFLTIFSGKDILRKKTSAIECTKNGNWAGCNSAVNFDVILDWITFGYSFASELMFLWEGHWNRLLWFSMGRNSADVKLTWYIDNSYLSVFVLECFCTRIFNFLTWTVFSLIVVRDLNSLNQYYFRRASI